MGLRTVRIGCLLFVGPLLLAQEFRATVTGHVIDPSGAVMPAVTVQITNVGTNITNSAQSNTQGVYILPFLSPGKYRLTAEAPGFKRFVRDDIVLNVGDNIGADFRMEVGQSTESVTVTAETLALQTENANLGLMIDQMRVTELRLNARNPFFLAILAPGTNYNGPPNYVRPFDNGGNASWSMNGGENGKNEFLLDGAPNNSRAGANDIALTPPVDSVEEFKLQTNLYDAAFGKSSGGIVNVMLKSGTNGVHGTVYEFLRRSSFDASSFQNNAVGTPYGGHYLD